MSNETSLCELAEVYAKDTWLNVALLVQLVLCLTTLILLAVIAAKEQYRKIVVHPNLKILFVNVAVLCGVVSVFTIVWVLRFQIFRFAASDPCSLLIPVWISIMVRFPTYIYGTGFPLWHLAMTVERLLSTVQADKYEYARPTYSIVCSVLVWLVTVGHTAYHSWLALDDPQFSGNIVYATLSTATNARFLTVTGQVMVGLDLSTMMLDGITVCLNRSY